MNFPRPQPQPGSSPGNIILKVGTGRLEIQLELRPVGADWLLLVTGGEAHVGAAAVHGPHDGPAVAVLGSHREGPLVRECAARISEATGKACAVVGGIHQDQATAAEIAAIMANVRQGTAQLVRWLAAEGGQAF